MAGRRFASAAAIYGKKPAIRTAIVVPLHRELRKGTLAGILRDAGLTDDGLRRLL